MLLILERTRGGRTAKCVAYFEKDDYGDWHCTEAPPVMAWMVGTAPRRIKRWLEGPGREQGWTYRWEEDDGQPLTEAARESIPEVLEALTELHAEPEVWAVRR